MHLNSGPLPSANADAYLAKIEALTQELRLAMGAMAANALPDFQESLVRQRVTCARLAELQSLNPVPSAKTGSLASGIVHLDLAARTTAAILTLREVTRHYSTLLKHFEETAGIFTRMFRGYGGPQGSTSYVQKVTSTWFCEL